MHTARSSAGLSEARRAEFRGWALLAVGALAAAGVLALLLALSRAPGVAERLPWGPHFFPRALITHVVLSFQVWFLACLGALSARHGVEGERIGCAGLALAIAGTIVLPLPALLDQGLPSLNNYVPVVAHPLFHAGLVAVAAGVALGSLRLLPVLVSKGAEPAAFIAACAAAAFLAALACIAIAWVLMPGGLNPVVYYERLFWGGGHVLQFVNTLLLLAGWRLLAERRWGANAWPDRAERACAAVLALFAVAAPLLYLGSGPLDSANVAAFTGLLWLGLPAPLLLAGAVLAWRLARGGAGKGLERTALTLSLAVFALGGISGFWADGGDTRTPAHYHTVIGGVNLALFGWLLLQGRAPGKAAPVALHLYAWGQMLHALGFWLAGAAGVPRKTMGAAQGLDSGWKVLAMALTGVGGTIAVIGGVMVVALLLARLLRSETS